MNRLNYLLLIPIFFKYSTMFAWFSLLFQVKRWRAVTRFKRTLTSSGIGKKEADMLGKNYPFKLSDITKFLWKRDSN